MFALLLLSLVQTASAETAPVAQVAAPIATEKTAAYDHVILISVDGLRSDALLVEKSHELPNFKRLTEQGASTLNARTDSVYTFTLPNHVGMLSGRIATGKYGHGWFTNATPKIHESILERTGSQVEGIFHVTAAAGIDDAMIASKPKFALFRQSWMVGEDAVIDLWMKETDTHKQLQATFDMLDPQKHPRSMVFLHLRAPDDAGHDHGWNMTPKSEYLTAVAAVDQTLGELFAFLDAHEEIKARTAIVLTSDHGGGIPHKNHHGYGLHWVNYVIPFFVWTPNMTGPQDLYAINPGQYLEPGIKMPKSIHVGPQPIRNCDAANLCMSLLGLPSVSGSTINQDQQLRWQTAETFKDE
ncbi:MAG: sulfatase-like hydrolase/transferase [Planctomycetes bacterium]|nr:sulfatase-like hydrolase/transferase [Planctomycetota bacterium]MCP4770896.1 sulfatase-like hydrolase/transferase [Planctomycetota bacterium]MCP4862279.1 sulfatase-like hydrolase/transferase [Planctomycetota bacterium]